MLQATRGPGPAPNPTALQRREPQGREGEVLVGLWGSVLARAGRQGAAQLRRGGRGLRTVPGHPEPHMQRIAGQRPDWPVWGHGEGRRLGSVRSKTTGPPGGLARGLGAGTPPRQSNLPGWAGRPVAPRACVGLLEAAIHLQSPCKPEALSTGKYWEPPPPLAGVRQSSPVLVARSWRFYTGSSARSRAGKGGGSPALPAPPPGQRAAASSFSLETPYACFSVE